MQRISDSTNYIHESLRLLFEAHDVAAVVRADGIRFPNHPQLWVNGELFAYSDQTVQLDVRLGGFDGDRVLIESIAGFGADLSSQANVALQGFANASFHVLLSAFFGRPLCHGTEKETWIIGGPRVVYSGLLTTAFGYPPPKPNGTPNLDFYPAIIQRLKSCSLPPGTHWIRIYQMRHAGKALSNEVLLDNDPWDELQAFTSTYDWPESDRPYDVRVFLVVKDPE